MKQLTNTKDGGYEVLEFQEKADLEPKSNELIIEVQAAGINFADILARKGQYADAPPKPCVMGYEVSGIVAKVGDQISNEWLGKEVFAMCKFGGQATQVAVREPLVYEKPSKLSFVEAASVPVTYLTAWALLVAMGGLKSYESILIQNVGGGVGLAQLDIAKHIGATTYGTASAGKHAFLKERGLDYVIDYRNKDWYNEIMRLTNHKGVELITDPLGGKESKKAYKALRATGRIGMFGISSASKNVKGGLSAKWNVLKTVAAMPFYHPLSLIGNNKGAFGVNLGHLWHEPEKAKHWMSEILKGIEEGWLNPHVDSTYKFENAAQAHQHMEERKNIGKVVLVV